MKKNEMNEYMNGFTDSFDALSDVLDNSLGKNDQRTKEGLLNILNDVIQEIHRQNEFIVKQLFSKDIIDTIEDFIKLTNQNTDKENKIILVVDSTITH